MKNLERSQDNKVESRKERGKSITEDEVIETRASTTDPESRKMKMGDGGFRLGYNVQFATGVDSRVIFGVDVVNTLDVGTAPSMICRVNHRLKKLGLQLKNWLGDSAYSSQKVVNIVAELFPDLNYIAPAKVNKNVDPKKEQRTDSDAVKKWRKNLDTEETKERYKKRCSTAEFSNAQAKNRGMTEFLVRGICKAKASALLYALAHNVLRFLDLTRKIA